MIQLWAWKYQGQDEVGTQKPGNSCVFKSAASEAIPILRHTDHITNLRKVKVVDEDAVVLDNKDFEKSLFIAQAQGGYKQISLPEKIADKIWAQIYQLAQTPPIIEPKNFGAIVEAQYFGYNSEKYLKARFFNNGRDWILEGTLNNFAWSDLINPTIISEGVEG